MFVCVLCEKETCYISNLCNKCRRVKHLLNLYDERVYDVLENVLVRTEKGINNKSTIELKAEKEKVEKKITSK
jgi:hypothetical protein